MAMIEVPRTDRRLVNLPDVRAFRDNPGERWGVVADTAGRALGGLADGLDAIGRVQAARLRMQERADREQEARRRVEDHDRENEAALLASRYRAHSRNGWNGYMDRDAAGNEVRVPGARERSYDSYGKGETTLSDIEAIDKSFRERDDYRKMDAATREIFERKILPCRDEMMQLAQQKAYADRVARGRAEFDEKVQEWGKEVETTFGGDDAAYAGASEQCSVREAVATFAFGEVENASELDAMDGVSVEDVRFRNDPNGAKARRLRQLVEAKQKVYDRRYFDALCASAAAGRPLGALSPEACAAKAAEFAQGIGETDAERADLSGKAEKARLHLESVRADERAAAVRTEREASVRRQDEFWKGNPAPSSTPAFLDSEAEAAERAGDFSRALEFRQRSARMRDALEKSAKEAREAAEDEAMQREELELYRGGRQPSEEERRAFDVRWQQILEKRDAKAALGHAKRASALSDAIDARNVRERRETLARNFDRLQWMRIAEQDKRAKGDTRKANELLQDICYEFEALKLERGLSAGDAESFTRELSRQPSDEDAVLLGLFDAKFDITLDEDGDGTVTASEVRAFGKSGDRFEPDWAKGDRVDARTRLRMRREFMDQLARLPPQIDRRSAAKDVLKQFEKQYVKGKFEDHISYMADLFTDLRTGSEQRYGQIQAARERRSRAAEAARRKDAERKYATPEADARLRREEAGGGEEAFPWMRPGGVLNMND